MYVFYRLTDVLHKGRIVRFESAGHRCEYYNTAKARWEPYPEFVFNYCFPESVYCGFYEEITQSQAQQSIQQGTTRWTGYWGIAKNLLHHCNGLQSPIKGMDYVAYVRWLSGFARNEEDRVLYALSGFPGLPKWKSLLSQAGIPQFMLEYLQVYHNGTFELYRETNRVVLEAVLQELELLSTRTDL